MWNVSHPAARLEKIINVLRIEVNCCAWVVSGQSGEILKKAKEHSKQINDIQPSVDLTMFISASKDNTAKVRPPGHFPGPLTQLLPDSFATGSPNVSFLLCDVCNLTLVVMWCTVFFSLALNFAAVWHQTWLPSVVCHLFPLSCSTPHLWITSRPSRQRGPSTPLPSLPLWIM